MLTVQGNPCPGSVDCHAKSWNLGQKALKGTARDLLSNIGTLASRHWHRQRGEGRRAWRAMAPAILPICCFKAYNSSAAYKCVSIVVPIQPIACL